MDKPHEMTITVNGGIFGKIDVDIEYDYEPPDFQVMKDAEVTIHAVYWEDTDIMPDICMTWWDSINFQVLSMHEAREAA